MFLGVADVFIRPALRRSCKIVDILIFPFRRAKSESSKITQRDKVGVSVWLSFGSVCFVLGKFLSNHSYRLIEVWRFWLNIYQLGEFNCHTERQTYFF